MRTYLAINTRKMKTATTHSAFLLKTIPLLVFLFSVTWVSAQESSLIANYNAEDSLAEEANLKNAVAEFTSRTNAFSLQEYISSELEFPNEGRAKGLYGSVTVRFEVLADGDIGTIVILDSPGPSFDASVKEFLNEMPLWTPAYSNSVPVASVRQLELNFRLR